MKNENTSKNRKIKISMHKRARGVFWGQEREKKEAKKANDAKRCILSK